MSRNIASLLRDYCFSVLCMDRTHLKSCLFEALTLKWGSVERLNGASGVGDHRGMTERAGDGQPAWEGAGRKCDSRLWIFERILWGGVIELQNLLGSRFSLVTAGKGFLFSLLLTGKGLVPEGQRLGRTHLAVIWDSVLLWRCVNTGSSPMRVPFALTPLPHSQLYMILEVWGFSPTPSNSATPAGVCNLTQLQRSPWRSVLSHQTPSAPTSDVGVNILGPQVTAASVLLGHKLTHLPLGFDYVLEQLPELRETRLPAD